MKVSREVYETTDYSLFVHSEHNRDIGRTDKIMRSMKRKGFMSEHPIRVFKTGKKYRIDDGAHRFEVAKSLGLSIHFVISKDPEINIADLNNTARGWTLKDFLSSFVKQGNPHYIEVQALYERTGIQLQQCVAMLSGEQAGSHNGTDKFKAGMFVVNGRAHARIVGGIVESIIGHVKWVRNSDFVNALSRCAYCHEFNPDIFISRVCTYPHLMHKQATIADYTNLIEQVYNHRSRSPVPIKFLADKRARERNVCGSLKLKEDAP